MHGRSYGDIMFFLLSFNMNNDLQKALIENKVRENSGSISSNGFDYQKDWSICKLLEEHEKGKNYVLLFDFHEDLVILDSELNPTQADFYQIKTKAAGCWTMHQLLKRKENKDKTFSASILGKLYYNKILFAESVRSLNFASNTGYDVKLADGTRSKSKANIAMNKLTLEEINNLKDKIRIEYGSEESLTCESIIFLIVSNLNIIDHDTYTIGRIARFLDGINSGKYNVNLVYRTFFDQVKRKSDYDSNKISSFSEMLTYKGITKKDFEGMIEEFIAIKDKNYDDEWQQIQARLDSEAFTIQEVLTYKNEYRRYFIDKTNSTNELLLQIIKRMKEVRKILSAAGKLNVSLKKCLDLFIENYYENPIEQDLYTENYLRVIIFDIIYND